MKLVTRERESHRVGHVRRADIRCLAANRRGNRRRRIRLAEALERVAHILPYLRGG